MGKSGLAVVVAETGAAVFLEPILAEWLSGRGPGIPWHIIAGPPAARRLTAVFGDRLPLAAVASTDDDVGPLVAQSSAMLISAGRDRLMESHALRQARIGNIPSLQFVDTWYNYRLRFLRGDELVMADRVMVIDSVALADAVAEGLPREKLLVAGQPAWERVSSNLPAASCRRTLVLGSPIRELLGDSLGYDQVTCWNLVAEAAGRRPDLFSELAYAPHPDERWAPSGVATIRDSVSALADYGTVLGSFAAPMIDAFLGGRRVVSVQPRAVGHDPCPLSKQGLVPRAGDADQLIDAMSMPPVAPDGLRARLAGSLAHVRACIDSVLIRAHSASLGR